MTPGTMAGKRRKAPVHYRPVGLDAMIAEVRGQLPEEDHSPKRWPRFYLKADELHGKTARFYMDGQELHGVHHVEIAVDVNGVNHVKVTFFAKSVEGDVVGLVTKGEPDGEQPGAAEEGQPGTDRPEGDDHPAGQDGVVPTGAEE